MLIVTYRYDLAQVHKGEVERRHGPFESEAEAIDWLRHEGVEGTFDIIKYVSTYKE